MAQMGAGEFRRVPHAMRIPGLHQSSPSACFLCIICQPKSQQRSHELFQWFSTGLVPYFGEKICMNPAT